MSIEPREQIAYTLVLGGLFIQSNRIPVYVRWIKVSSHFTNCSVFERWRLFTDYLST